MPITVNGIGTHYYGRANSFRRPGVCTQCKQSGSLESYDVGHYFVVLYIPVLPLGRRQVLDQCPHCSAHRAMSLKAYRTARETSIETAMQKLADQPDDPVAAVRLLQTCSAFNEMEQANDLAEALETQFHDRADVQFFLAAWLEEVGGDIQRREKCLVRACELEPEILHYRRSLAHLLITRLRFDDAIGQLQPFLPDTENFDRELVLYLAFTAQHAEQYDLAMKYFSLANHDGALAKQKDFRKAVARCEKALAARPSDPGRMR